MLDYGFYNMDCMIGMRDFPDNYFDLAIVDPPYGIGIMSMTYTKSGAVRTHGYSVAKRRDYRKLGEWDEKPEKSYFDELQRVSKKQIIWGGVITFPTCCRLRKAMSCGTSGATIRCAMIFLIANTLGCQRVMALREFFDMCGTE